MPVMAGSRRAACRYSSPAIVARVRRARKVAWRRGHACSGSVTPGNTAASTVTLGCRPARRTPLSATDVAGHARRAARGASRTACIASPTGAVSTSGEGVGVGHVRGHGPIRAGPARLRHPGLTASTVTRRTDARPARAYDRPNAACSTRGGAGGTTAARTPDDADEDRLASPLGRLPIGRTHPDGRLAVRRLYGRYTGRISASSGRGSGMT
jgi:hypothetical protein